MSEAEARRYGGKIKGMSAGAPAAAGRRAVAGSRKKKFKRAGVFGGSGFLGLGRSRQTVRANRARRNASTHTGIFDSFQGRASRVTKKPLASDHVPNDVDVLGSLEEMVVKQKGKAGQRVAFNPRRHLLAASRGKPGRFKLHILGAKFKHRSNPGELHDIGEIHKVVYVTSKQHLGDGSQKVHYTHTLKAPYPKLCVDQDGAPVIHDPKGGRQINARGIID